MLVTCGHGANCLFHSRDPARRNDFLNPLQDLPIVHKAFLWVGLIMDLISKGAQLLSKFQVVKVPAALMWQHWRAAFAQWRCSLQAEPAAAFGSSAVCRAVWLSSCVCNSCPGCNASRPSASNIWIQFRNAHCPEWCPRP